MEVWRGDMLTRRRGQGGKPKQEELMKLIPPSGCNADGSKAFLCGECGHVFTAKRGDFERCTAFAHCGEIFYTGKCVACGADCECR